MIFLALYILHYLYYFFKTIFEGIALKNPSAYPIYFNYLIFYHFLFILILLAFVFFLVPFRTNFKNDVLNFVLDNFEFRKLFFICIFILAPFLTRLILPIADDIGLFDSDDVNEETLLMMKYILAHLVNVLLCFLFLAS